MDQDKIRETMDHLSQLIGYTPPAPPPAASPAGSPDYDHCPRIAGGCNVLLYGVPGSGKSWTIQNEYCRDEARMERLVFHPDYTYSDFVGQILPTVSDTGGVQYVFTPGPFTRILQKAYTHPDTEYFLIIEEINRGNAPSIFGDVFQLLDRVTKQDRSGLPVGTSEYSITNRDVAAIVYQDPDHKVRIPSNLSILGTMNTSDQNVFTLDTAFQRRWEMQLIENSFEMHPYADKPILDTDVTWRAFCQAVNREILDSNLRMTSSEDKRLGAYFVREADLEYDRLADDPAAGERERSAARRHNRRFPEKVLKYLWDDAFRFSRDTIFELEDCQSLEALLHRFLSASGNGRFGIFKESILQAMTAGQETIGD